MNAPEITPALSREDANQILTSLAPIPPKLPEDIKSMAVRLAQGETMSEIGKTYGVTRQAVAGRINRSSPWRVDSIRAARERAVEEQTRALSADLVEWSRAYPSAPASDAAAKFKISTATALDLLGDRAELHRPAPSRRGAPTRYSDDKLIEDIKQWHEETGEHAGEKFSEWAASRGTPGHQTASKRFGRWTSALKEAGIEAVTVERAIGCLYSDADLWAALVDVVREKQNASTGDYQRWVARHPSAPTLSWLFQRLGGTWSVLRTEALRITEGTSDKPADLLADIAAKRDWSAPLGERIDPLEYIKRAVADVGPSLPMTAYRAWARNNSAPGVHAIKARIPGLSWGEIVERAGGKASSQVYTRFSDDAILTSLAQFLRENPNGTSLAYETWRKENSGPALTTLLYRFGSWSAASLAGHDAKLAADRAQ